jgi:hypothetical protein
LSYEVLRGRLSSYYGFGLLSDWQGEEIEEALEALCRAGEIKVLKRGFWKERVALGERPGMNRMH